MCHKAGARLTGDKRKHGFRLCLTRAPECSGGGGGRPRRPVRLLVQQESLFMHHASLATSFVRSSILCLVVGTALGATLAPAIAATGTEPPKMKPVGQDSSTRRAAELTKKRAAEQKCVQAEKAMGKAVDSARSAMRQAIGSFHDATDVEAADMTDDDIANLADDAAEELAAAAAACAAAIQAQHDRAVAELTAAHADSKLIATWTRSSAGAGLRWSRWSAMQSTF